MTVQFEEKDERKATCPIPATEVECEQLGKFLVNAGQDGYKLIDASLPEGGHQRDPYPIGLRITVAK